METLKSQYKTLRAAAVDTNSDLDEVLPTNLHDVSLDGFVQLFKQVYPDHLETNTQTIDSKYKFFKNIRQVADGTKFAPYVNSLILQIKRDQYTYVDYAMTHPTKLIFFSGSIILLILDYLMRDSIPDDKKTSWRTFNAITLSVVTAWSFFGQANLDVEHRLSPWVTGGTVGLNILVIALVIVLVLLICTIVLTPPSVRSLPSRYAKFER
jgi:hypothetical protein